MLMTLCYSILERLLPQSRKFSMKILIKLDPGSVITAYFKTEALLFGTHVRLSDENFSRVFKGRPIKRVYKFKYLGVVFDKHISWNSHVKYVSSRVGKRLGMLGRIRGNLTSDCANSIYTAYIRPVMDY